MTFRNSKVFLVAAAAVAGGAASAQDLDGLPLSLGLGLTTSGPALEATYRFAPQFAARALVAGFPSSLERTETVDGADLDIEADLGAYGLILDYYVGGSGFRVSGGIMQSTLAADLSASGDIEIDGTTYTGAALEGDLEYENPTAPLLAVGYRREFGNLFVSGEVGAMFTGAVEVDVRETTEGGNVIPQDDIDTFISDAEEALDIGIFPHVALMVGYVF